MKLIGLNGRMRSGKDTAFDVIEDEARYIFESLWHKSDVVVERHGFADLMKLSAAAALGFDSLNVEDAVALCNALKESGTIDVRWENPISGDLLKHFISGREYQQFYGTEAHRSIFGFDFWVDALLPQPSSAPDHDSRLCDNAAALEERFPGVDLIVVTDVRFDNEAARILRLGGEVWHIDATERLGPLGNGSHPSEFGLPPFYVTRTVRNDGSLMDFESAVSAAITEALCA